MAHFCLSVRFLQALFHGRRDGAEPEWPPSPLRAFQSLVAADGTLTRDRRPSSRPALEWLERLPAATVIAPRAAVGSGYRLSVPNNSLDVVAAAWARGNESNTGDANPATHRTMKAVRPHRLLDGEVIHYLWPVAEPIGDEDRAHASALAHVARNIVVLGWGIDLVAGRARLLSSAEVEGLVGERWLPGAPASGHGLRVPTSGTLAGLYERHRRFVGRIEDETLDAPPPLVAFGVLEYRRATAPPGVPVAAFSLLKLDASGFASFHSARRGLSVAGMMRHAAKRVATQAGWSPAAVASFALGHTQAEGERPSDPGRRFAYLPLPSLEARRPAEVVGSIRRALFVAPPGCEPEVAWARRSLAASDLIDARTGEAVALLSLIPETDGGVHRYLRPSSTWATVTPVVLPGHDDPCGLRRRPSSDALASQRRHRRLEARIDGLFRKAITQAGFSPVLARHASLEWSHAGFLPGVDVASRYGAPDHLASFPRFHVRLQWRDERGAPLRLPGPLCIGSGRYFGIGLFAPMEER